MFDDLNEDNFMMYAMKAYVSPHCIMSEFEGDIKRIKYLKRLFRRYKITKSLKERLILNHIILLNNVFGPKVTARILFYKIDERDYDTWLVSVEDFEVVETAHANPTEATASDAS